MKLSKQLFQAGLLCLLLVLAGCSDRPAAQHHIVVATLMSHPALDQVVASMKEELAAEGFVEGRNLAITMQNANGEMGLIPGIVQTVKSQQPELVVAITTPVAQAFAKNRPAPLVFSAVTDPVGAGVVKSMDAVTEDVSGVSDAWPYRQQMELIKKITPAAVKLGVVYNPGEAASQYGIKRIRGLAAGLGLELTEIVATKTVEVKDALAQFIDRVDAVYLSSDNTVIQALPAALKVCLEHKKPLYVGDSGTVEKGGLAAVSVGYAGVGRETGKIVAQFLQDNRKVQPVVAQGDQVYLNLQTAAKIGVTIPPAVVAAATETYQ